MGYLRKSLTPKGDDILVYISISNLQHHRNHSVDQQKSVPMSLYASTVHGKVFISDKIQSCTKYLQHTHDSTIGLEPTRTTEDCRTFGAHLEILLYTAAT